MTLRKVKEVDNKVEMPLRKTTQIIPLEYEDPSTKDKEDSNPQEAHFPQRLTKVKKRSITGEIMEIFKQGSIDISLLDAIKQMPFYAKFFKDLCTKKKNIHF